MRTILTAALGAVLFMACGCVSWIPEKWRGDIPDAIRINIDPYKKGELPPIVKCDLCGYPINSAAHELGCKEGKREDISK